MLYFTGVIMGNVHNYVELLVSVFNYICNI